MIFLFHHRCLRLPVASFAELVFGPTLANHIAILRVEFHRPALAAKLLARNQRRAAAAEGVEDDVAFLRRILQEVAEHLRRLHRGMDIVLLRLVELHDGGLRPVAVPVVCLAVLPAIEAGLMDPLVILAAEYERVFFPYMESRYLYRAFVASVASGFTGTGDMDCEGMSLVLKPVVIAFAGFSL